MKQKFQKCWWCYHTRKEGNKSLSKNNENIITNNAKVKVIYQQQIINNIKDRPDFCCQNKIVFNSSCCNETFNKDFIENQKDRRKTEVSEQ